MSRKFRHKLFFSLIIYSKWNDRVAAIDKKDTEVSIIYRMKCKAKSSISNFTFRRAGNWYFFPFFLIKVIGFFSRYYYQVAAQGRNSKAILYLNFYQFIIDDFSDKAFFFTPQHPHFVSDIHNRY